MTDDKSYISKIPLSNDSLTNIFSINDDRTIENIFNMYLIMINETNLNNTNEYNRTVDDLYNSWLFDYRCNSSYIDGINIDNFINRLNHKYIIGLNELNKHKLKFAVQTYYVMIVNLLVNEFITCLKLNNEECNELSWSDITSIFCNSNDEVKNILKEFFELSYYEWFISVNKDVVYKIREIINSICYRLNTIDLRPSKIRLCNIHDLFDGIYLNLFNNVDLTIHDNNFIMLEQLDMLNKVNSLKVSCLNNIEPFKFNLLKNYCSLISSKAMYVITVFSCLESFNIDEPLSIPLYANNENAYERNLDDISFSIITIKTYVGDFKIPKLDSFNDVKFLIDQMHSSILFFNSFDKFWEIAQKNEKLGDSLKIIVRELYETLMLLRTPIQYDFWGIYIKNKLIPKLFN